MLLVVRGDEETDNDSFFNWLNEVCATVLGLYIGLNFDFMINCKKDFIWLYFSGIFSLL